MLAAALAAGAVMSATALGASGAVAKPGDGPGGASDRALARKSLRHPVQEEQFYFVMPDRFRNGDRSNDTGGLPGGDTDADVLRHGFDPERRGS